MEDGGRGFTYFLVNITFVSGTFSFWKSVGVENFPRLGDSVSRTRYVSECFLTFGSSPVNVYCNEGTVADTGTRRETPFTTSDEDGVLPLCG